MIICKLARREKRHDGKNEVAVVICSLTGQFSTCHLPANYCSRAQEHRCKDPAGESLREFYGIVDSAVIRKLLKDHWTDLYATSLVSTDHSGQKLKAAKSLMIGLKMSCAF